MVKMKKSRYEAFRIDSDLMAIIRKFALADGRKIKTTIERILREKFAMMRIETK